MTDQAPYRCRGAITGMEMVKLVQAHGGHAVPGWWDRVRPHSLGWVTARLDDATLVGFVNVAWDDAAYWRDPQAYLDPRIWRPASALA